MYYIFIVIIDFIFDFINRTTLCITSLPPMLKASPELEVPKVSPARSFGYIDLYIIYYIS